MKYGNARQRAPGFTLLGRDGLPYVKDVDCFYTGFEGLLCHRIPEEPDTYTVSHFTGLRICSGRFPSVDKACEVLEKCFASTVNFNRSIVELSADPNFAMFSEAFRRNNQLVPRSMENVKRIDLAAQIIEKGAASVVKGLNKK